MPNEPDTFRDQLLSAQTTTPTLRAGYQKELDAMLHPPMTLRTAAPGIVLLAILLACIAGLVRNLVFHRPEPLVGASWGILAIAFAWAAVLIVRDLWRRKHSRKSTFSIAGVLTAAAGAITVVALIRGMNAPSDPASLFNAFYVFVFYVACGAWSLESRIASAELATRENMLRLESRIVDLMDRLPK
jgi:uncharacterized membrane protein